MKRKERENVLKIKSEFINLISPLSNEEYDELKESILTYGCRDPLVIWNDTIIDGHNRYQICKANNITFNTVDMTFDFETEDEVKAWIIKNQFARRNIDKYQRSQLALQLKDIIAAKARENQKSGLRQFNITDESTVLMNSSKRQNDRQSGLLMDSSKSQEEVNGKESEKLLQNCVEAIESINTRMQLAEMAGVSEQTIDRVKTIETQAPESVKTAARKNVVSINKAYEITKAVKDLPQENQEEEAQRLMYEERQRKFAAIDRQYKMANAVFDAINKLARLQPDEECFTAYMNKYPNQNKDLPYDLNRILENVETIKRLHKEFNSLKVVKS